MRERGFTLLEVLLSIGLLAVVVLGALVLAGRSYAKMRGTRLVTCPENKATAAVEVNATRAAALSLLGQRAVRLKDCSRWPEKENCGQECLRHRGASLRSTSPDRPAVFETEN